MAEEKTTATGDKGLAELCSYIKKSIMSRKYDHAECALRIAKAMESYPDAAEPHNLLGILLEESGDHCGAMRHFRAAWELFCREPQYKKVCLRGLRLRSP